MRVGTFLFVPPRVPITIALSLVAPLLLADPPSLTIYNQNFAVVREEVALNLKPGTNQARYEGVTAFLEPSSVMLRDPAGKLDFQILEQNFRNDALSRESLLQLNEGKTISFEVMGSEGGQLRRDLVRGKIVRSGSLPLIEVDGNLRFNLPGEPLFPALGKDTILKPTLVWLIRAGTSAHVGAELSYVTAGLGWEADYNLVLPPQGETLDLVGWITMDNQSGKSFENARVKLLAGDVNKVERFPPRGISLGYLGGGGGGPPVSEKAFDEYHLYTLDRPATLLDRERKQVEFLQANGVQSTPLYVYDGASGEPDQVWDVQAEHLEPAYGSQENRKVWVFREFTNSAANHLGMPLPKGTLRVYRRDSDGQLELTGESTIKHTPRDEVVRLFTGSAFDVVGTRSQTQYKALNPARAVGAVDPNTGLPATSKEGEWGTLDESFEIKLRNHKREGVRVRVVEHLYRWSNWDVRQASQAFEKKDSRTVEFPVDLEPGAEQSVRYTAHYWW